MVKMLFKNEKFMQIFREINKYFEIKYFNDILQSKY